MLNRDLWEALSSLIDARARGELDWRWVRGHVGTPGNERCDEIAVAFAVQGPADLYDGPLDSYPRPMLELPDDTSLPKRSPASGSGAKTKAPPTRTSASWTACRCGTARGPSAKAA